MSPEQRDSQKPPRGAGPIDQTAVRHHNLGIVLRHIAEHGPRSRARVALETGLNKTTVSSLVSELLGYGLVAERGAENPGAVGRPGRRIELSGARVAALGLEVDVSYLAACVLDLTGVVRYHEIVPADNRGVEPGRVAARLAEVARDALAVLEREQLVCAGATVALPGPVDATSETLLVGPNLGWREVGFATLLRDRLQAPFPISVGNDANLGALAELWDGAGRGLGDFVYVHGGWPGIGAGVVARGELLRGAGGLTGEFGHLTVQPRGPLCACGNRGCLESFAGLEAVRVAAGIAAAEEPSEELIRRVRDGDPQALRAVLDAARWLAIGIAGLINLFDTEAVVLGGYYAQLADVMLPRIERELERRVLAGRWSSCRVLVSTLDGEAPLRGAAALTLHALLADPSQAQHLVIDNVTSAH